MDPITKSVKNLGRHLSQTAGFTLVELMVALAVSGIVMAAVMTSFVSQHNVYLMQGQVVEMQENARVAMNMLEMDIRSAGFNPIHLVGAGITTADIAANGVAPDLTFTRDNGAGVLETISYQLVDAFSDVARNDGFMDDLGRQVNAGGFQPVAENISGRLAAIPLAPPPGLLHLEFRYLDGNGLPTTVLSDIHSIQVSFLAQSAQRTSTSSTPSRDIYTTPSGAIWQADANFWNLYLTTTINCRNLGL